MLDQIRTAKECGLEKAEQLSHVIPPMTHPLSRWWHQPSRFQIEIDDTHALMLRATFDELHEYSCSTPTGVYEGKMWKYNHAAYHKVPEHERDDSWYLCWFGLSDNPDMCSNHSRKILIV